MGALLAALGIVCGSVRLPELYSAPRRLSRSRAPMMAPSYLVWTISMRLPCSGLILTILRSRPVLEAWPQLLQGNLRLAAVVDGEVLVGHRVGVANFARRFDGVEIAFKFLPANTQHRDALGLVLPWSPETVALVMADVFWQAVLRAE